MAINFNQYFAAMGDLGKILHAAHTYGGSGGTQPAAFADAIASLQHLQPVAALLPPAQETARQAAFTSVKAVVAAATRDLTIRTMVTNVPAISPDLRGALEELIRQMDAGAQSVQSFSRGVTVTAAAANAGNGTVLTSLARGDGYEQANLFAENATLVCANDAQSGGATKGQEPFTYTGGVAPTDVYDDRWPGQSGSGTTLNFNAVDSLATNASQLLTNASFETETATGWTGWDIQTGTFNTHLGPSTTQFYRGLKSLRLDGDGTTLTALKQDFGSAAGATARLAPMTAYGVCWRARADTAPTGGQLRVELTDGNNDPTADAQALQNRITQTMLGLGTAWVTVSGAFRTPKVLPATLRLRVYLSTALNAGAKVYLDDFSFTPLTRLYPGGPLAAVFSGSVPWVARPPASSPVRRDADRFTLAFTNPRTNPTFQSFFDRVFDMRGLGLLLPESATPTQSDTLLTA